MSISKTLLTLSPKHVVLIVLVSAFMSAWSTILVLKPQVNQFLERIESSYDSLIPEISIIDGKASIKERQPHYLTSLADKDVTLVIDTRDNKQREAYEYIKETPYGVAVSRDFMVFRNHDQLSEISFRNLPDMVINSTSLLGALNEYSSSIWMMAWTFFIFYFLMAKSAQVCLFAFIPMIVTKRLSCPLTFSDATKFTAAALIIPVIVDFLLEWLSILSSVTTLIYFCLYAVILVKISRDYIRFCSEEASSSNQ